MTSLPDSLRPWREWLSWFEPELAAHVGAMLRQLHPLMGAFRGASQGGEPELEGLDDLRLRGSYEHLLSTEWLLAEDMPDEFLRRAASGEHMFLAPRPRARRADRAIVALFDTGPLQFGAPRLAHLAIWILLARRAQQIKGEFRWGTLQNPGELFEARTTDHLKTMLSRRTFTEGDSEDLSGCPIPPETDWSGGERWLVGSAHAMTALRSAPGFTHRICLQRDLHGGSLEVSLRERGAERELNLVLPDATAAAPLLRGRFEREAAPEHYTSDPRAVALTRPPVISIDGSRVAVALRDESAALVYNVPRNANDRLAAPRSQRWSQRYSALALKFMGKRLGALLADANELRFWGSSMSPTPFPPPEEFHAPGSTAAWLPVAWMKAGSRHRLAVIDQSQRLMRWDSNHDSSRGAPQQRGLKCVRENVLGMMQVNKELAVFAWREHGQVWVARLGADGEPQNVGAFCEAPHDVQVLFGGRGIAVRTSREGGDVWRIGNWKLHRPTLQLRLPPERTAIGLVRSSDGNATGLITLDDVAGQQCLQIHGADGSTHRLYEPPERVVSHAVCPTSGLVALMTQQRQFIVVSAVTRNLRLFVQTAQQKHASA
jgi:hypothetical protein